MKLAAVLLALGVAVLAGCDDAPRVAAPPPAEVTDTTVGQYCGMLLVNHEGPKGQVHVAHRREPFWFSSVRDTIAFTRLPEEPKDITAIYVNDMAKATDWARPEPGTWIDARTAFYVVGSARTGGMGGAETVPFGSRAAAEAFAARHGGQVMTFAAIPDAFVLGGDERGPGEADGRRN